MRTSYPLLYSPLFRGGVIARGVADGRFRMTRHGLEKRCSVCHDFWPADTEFFYEQRQTLSSQCRACHAEKLASSRRQQP